MTNPVTKLPHGYLYLFVSPNKTASLMRVECSYMFLIVVLEKMSESPLDSKEIKPSFRLILKEINPEYSLEVLMLN